MGLLVQPGWAGEGKMDYQHRWVRARGQDGLPAWSGWGWGRARWITDTSGVGAECFAVFKEGRNHQGYQQDLAIAIANSAACLNFLDRL